jgi:predicted pyridoxine 5'-phosphate oxidase superfamily flavin-nucleotide-binding protein
VRVVDETTIAFPNYDGNGKYQSMGNLLQNPNLGILFIDFEGQLRLRLQGVASIDENDPLLAEYHEAQFIVRVKVTEAYKNCPRYIHRYKFIETSEYVPHLGHETPQPEWKKSADLYE